MKKKIIASIAAAALALMFASCDNANTQGSAESPSIDQPSGTTATSEIKLPEKELKEEFDGIFKFIPTADGTSYKVRLAADYDAETLVFPGEYEGVPVTEIQSVSFPYELKSSKIVISEGITTVGAMAFEDAACLTSVTFPSTLKKLPANAFIRTNLSSITISEKNEIFYVKGNCLIEKSTGTLALGCKNSVIPDDGSIVKIGHSAFEHSALQTIKIPSSVKNIGARAFLGCLNLTEIDISGAEAIEEYAFASCIALEKVVVSEKLRFIGDYGFDGCSNLSEINLPQDMATGKYSFRGCVNMPGYDHCLAYTILPQNGCYVSGIGSPEDSKITIPAVYGSVSVIGIKERALASVFDSSLVYISDGIKIIDDHALSGCLPQNVRLPSTIEYVGKDVFRKRDDAQYNEHGGALYLGNEENPYLVLIKSLCKEENLVVHNDTRVIACNAFENDTVLKTIDLPEGLVGIGENAFSGCKLKEVTLPSTLKRFSEYAFYECKALETVYLREGATRVENYEFSQIPKVFHIYLPSTTEYIGKQIFSGSYSAAEIQIHFNGTKAEWEAIKKSNIWNNTKRTVSVICADETIFITNQ